MPIVGVGDLVTDLSTSPDVTQSYFSKKMLTLAQYRQLYGRWATMEELPSNEGHTIILRRYLHLAMALSPLTAGVAPSGKTPILDDYKAQIVQHGDFIALNDYAKFTQKDPIMQKWTQLLGDQEGYTSDAVDRDTATAGTGIIYSNGTARTDINTTVDANDLDRAIRQLSNNGAEKSLSGNGGTTTVGTMPTMPAYPAITLPDVMMDLQNLEKFKWASEYRGAAEGEVGRFKQIALFESPDPSSLNAGGKKFASGGATSSAVKNTAGTVDVYTIMIFGKNFLSKVKLTAVSSQFFAKPLGSAGTADPLNQVATLGWKLNSARVISNQNWGVRIECGASL